MFIAAAAGYAIAIFLTIFSLVLPRPDPRKLKSVAFLVATDLCYALVVFTTPNVLTAICL
jgi:hypothetical protein